MSNGILSPNRVLSYDVTIEDSDTSLKDFVVDTVTPSPLDVVIAREFQDAVERVLAILDERERYIMRNRFGINDEGVELTLREIGERLHISRERVRQIERDSKRRIRAAFEGSRCVLELIGKNGRGSQRFQRKKPKGFRS